MVPANQAPGSRLRVGWTGGITAYSEALGYALFTPLDPPFARGGNRSLARTLALIERNQNTVPRNRPLSTVNSNLSSPQRLLE